MAQTTHNPPSHLCPANPSVSTLSSKMVIDENLTITGRGAAGATHGPPATSLTVRIANLTVANGKAKDGDGDAPRTAGGSAAGTGGAFFSNKSTLTISGVIFRANQAQGDNGFGGGESFFGAAGGGVGGSEGGFAGGARGSGSALGGNGGAGDAAFERKLPYIPCACWVFLARPTVLYSSCG